LAEVPALEIDLEEHRKQLTALFDSSRLGTQGTGKQFRRLVRSVLSTSDVADLAAFTFLENVTLKQGLLADGDVRHRVEQTIQALHELAAAPTAMPATAENIAGANPIHFSGPTDSTVY